MADVTWYAVFTGIDDYTDDALDIRGAVNDVKAWYRYARRLGLPGERIIVCSSPKLSGDDLGDGAEGVTFYGADRDGVHGAFEDLAGRVKDNHGARALIAWTGHATAVPVGGQARGTLLAAADTDPADPKTLIPLQALIERTDAAIYGGERDPDGADASIVAFIDACHASTPAIAAFEGTKGDRTLAGCGAVALTATKPDQEAHVIEIDGERRGAFSWAVTTLLDRFGFEGGASRLTPADLYHRTRDMLGTLDLPQTPMVFSVTGEMNRPLFHGLNAQAQGAGQADLGDPLELWPGIERGVYRFPASSGTDIYVSRVEKVTNGFEPNSLYLPNTMPGTVGVTYGPGEAFSGSKPSDVTGFTMSTAWSTAGTPSTGSTWSIFKDGNAIGLLDLQQWSNGKAIFFGNTSSGTLLTSNADKITIYEGNVTQKTFAYEVTDT